MDRASGEQGAGNRQAAGGGSCRRKGCPAVLLWVPDIRDLKGGRRERAREDTRLSAGQGRMQVAFCRSQEAAAVPAAEEGGKRSRQQAGSRRQQLPVQVAGFRSQEVAAVPGGWGRSRRQQASDEDRGWEAP